MAFCIDNMNIGGTELNAVRTAARLDRSRVDLHVVCLQEDGPLVSRYAAAGVPVHHLPLSNLYGSDAIRKGRELGRWLQAGGFDILHAHDIYSNVFGVFWGRLAGLRTIASRRWWEGFTQLHWRAATRLGHRLADAVLANSAAVGELLRQEGVPARKIVIVNNFLDEHAFEGPADVLELRAELGLLPAHKVIGVVANLLPVKDHATLLRAFASLESDPTDLRLVLVGDGGERAALEGLAGELEIADRVVFAGRRANNPNLHHIFDISVLCSVSEGLPNSILEAMAAARPVVATAVGAAADAVVHGETGLLVPPANPARLGEAIDSLLRDRGRAEAMGVAGKHRAHALYSPESALGELEALYTRLAPRVSPSGDRQVVRFTQASAV